MNDPMPQILGKRIDGVWFVALAGDKVRLVSDQRLSVALKRAKFRILDGAET